MLDLKPVEITDISCYNRPVAEAIHQEHLFIKSISNFIFSVEDKRWLGGILRYSLDAVKSKYSLIPCPVASRRHFDPLVIIVIRL